MPTNNYHYIEILMLGSLERQELLLVTWHHITMCKQIVIIKQKNWYQKLLKNKEFN